MKILTGIIIYFLINTNLVCQVPEVLWHYDLQSMSFGMACAGDIDGDGSLEIVFSTYFNDETIYALNAEDGSLLWKYVTNGCNDAAPLILDVDGDGELEVLLHSSSNHHFFCFNGKDGTIKWMVNSVGTDSPPSVADGDNDGKLEIFGGDFAGRLFCLNAEDGKQVWSTQVDMESSIQSEAVIEDVDGDGELDCVVATYRSKKENKISAYRLKDGSEIWACNKPMDMMYHGATIADIDDDNKMEVIIGSFDGYLYCLNGVDGSVKWTFNFPDKGIIVAPTTVGDLNNDGNYEIAFASGNKLGVLDGKGNLVWDYYFDGWSGNFRGVVFTDMDNDGGLDVLFGTTLGKLIALKGENGELIFEYDIQKLYGKQYDLHHAPLVADFNNDGLTDIFFIGGYAEYPAVENSYGRAYMISVGKTTGPDWLMFRNNLKRNAFIPVNTSDVKTHNETETTLYPNPASDYIELKLGSDLDELLHPIKIYNSYGECVYKSAGDLSTSVNNIVRINISLLPVSAYYIKFGNKFNRFFIVR